MVVRKLVEDDQIVADLRDALRDGRSGLNYVPKLLELVIDRDAWRVRADERGEEFAFRTFDEFTQAAPLAGLGASPDLIDRVVGTGNPDLLRKLRAARHVGQGKRNDLRQPTVESTGSDSAAATPVTADRLARTAPAQYEAVRRGEKTINAAAIDAGIRPHRISVRLDRPESIARSLRQYLTVQQRAELARLLVENGT